MKVRVGGLIVWRYVPCPEFPPAERCARRQFAIKFGAAVEVEWELRRILDLGLPGDPKLRMIPEGAIPEGRKDDGTDTVRHANPAMQYMYHLARIVCPCIKVPAEEKMGAWHGELGTAKYEEVTTKDGEKKQGPEDDGEK